MKKPILGGYFDAAALSMASQSTAQTITISESRLICTPDQSESLLMRPSRLVGYLSNQTGALSKIGSTGKEHLAVTFTVEQRK